MTYDDWTSAGTYTRNAIERYTSTGTSALLDKADDYIELQNMLLEPYQMGATWSMKRQTFGSVMKLKDGNGQYLMNFADMMKEGTSKVLLGNPVTLMGDMPSIASGSKSVAYGNMRDTYVILDRFGFRVIRDIITKKGYILFYTTKRTGGAVRNFQSMKIMVTKA
jgi:HK97 family phage major capsid protein